MSEGIFREKLERMVVQYEEIVTRANRPLGPEGAFQRYEHPVVTRDHVPIHWRYDLDYRNNPLLLERLGVNSTFNPGAIEWNGKVRLIVRVEGADRKSFFAIAESENGLDNFRFCGRPLAIPVTEDPETNVYDMRLTQHEDGWIYGLFCAERKDATRPDDPSASRADCGVVRTKGMESWERLPDMVSGPQQRNVVLHPEFVDGKYALYTRPADSFVDTGAQNGIGWALVDSMERAVIEEEKIIDSRVYHTVKEVKNGQGPPPIKTPEGWLHIAHGVRNHACGLRYVLYLFMTDLKDASRVIYTPGGHFLSALGNERRGDTPGNLFCNGAARRDNGDVLIYYGASDTRINVVKSSIDQLVDYCVNTPGDPSRSAECMRQRNALIEKNEALIAGTNDPVLRTVLR